MKRLLTVCTMLAGLAGLACADDLAGFKYGHELAPTGKEWESVQELALNKEQPHAWFFSFENVDQARKVLPENSKYWQSLDGTWKFHWAPNPDERPADFHRVGFDASAWDNIPVPSSWNIVGLQKDGSQKYGTPIYVNQPVIFQHRVAVDDWKGGVMRTPNEKWTTYKHRNEVGSYLRTFTVPADWKGRQVFINFDGVDSFFYLWINGHYVGFSKNSRNTAEFNITPYLNEKGENTVAVEVYRSSDGSFLEAQDMFRLPGIFRTVALHSRPTVRVRDLVVKTDLDENYRDATMDINAELVNAGKKDFKNYKVRFSLFAHELYSDDNKLVDTKELNWDTNSAMVPKNGISKLGTDWKIKAPRLWSAEAPYRYTLVMEVMDKKGNVVETVSTIIGFKEVEIKDTPADKDEFGLAGRYYYVNGQPVKLKGVNRHECHPAVGHAITREMMHEEVMMMKRGNINHVRDSHYPDDPYWYVLCNKYGIYLEDEANIESHEYYYGDASLSHPKEWEAAHVARVMEMVHANVNNPCIVIWSLGNEAGPGQNFVKAYQALKKFDTTRPVQYERNNDIVDMGSNQYPSIGWVKYAVQGTDKGIKYPFHISEYAHSMGNAVGNLVDYWDAIESTNFFCGGAIWDWVDQSLYNYEPDGTRYLAYGGNFGDTPNDGQFVMNGIIFGDREPKPQYYEVKKVYQNVGVKMVDVEKGAIEVFNKNYFEPLQYLVKASLWKDGKCVQENLPMMENRMIHGPRMKKVNRLAYDYAKLEADSEYFVKVQFLLGSDMPWAKQGFVQAEEQLLVKKADKAPAINTVAGDAPGVKVLGEEGWSTVTGKDFKVVFNNKLGTIQELTYGNEKVITDGNGPRLNAFRAFVSNDNWCYQPWFQNGLHNLQPKVLSSVGIAYKDGVKEVHSYTIEYQAPNPARLESQNGRYDSGIHTLKENKDKPFGDEDFKFTVNQIWTVYPDGSIELQAAISSNNPSLVLARLGYEMKLPAKFSRFGYYGRGPVDNYNDRKTGQFIEEYHSTVAEQFANFPKPQQCGNHEETRWASFTDAQGNGLLIVNEDPYAVSALPYNALDMTLASHPHRLPKSDGTYVTIDSKVTGLGGNSCGQGGPVNEDRAFGVPTRMGFIIRPVGAKGGVHVSPASVKPLLMMREKNGDVVIESAEEGATIMYKVGNERKAHVYEGPIAFRDGGTIMAYDKKEPNLWVRMTYPKMEKINTEVTFASSEEHGEGSAAHLADGDPNSFWHTMYSVTVAKYPHWVDFDAGDVKNIKGFTYLPRQDNRNGNIKDYDIFVSQDGKNWGEAIHKGSFENNQKEKKVMLKAPVKARYFRFRALSSQDGQDFASGAELSIIAD